MSSIVQQKKKCIPITFLLKDIVKTEKQRPCLVYQDLLFDKAASVCDLLLTV